MRNCVPIRSLLRTNIKLPGKNVPVFFSVFLILLPAVFNKSTGQSALTVDTLTYTPEQLVFNILVTGCTQAANVEFKGSSQAVGYFEYNGQDMEFRKGIILSGGYAASAVGQNDSGGHSEEFNGSGDEDLDSIIVPNITNDAAVIEFDFIPSSDSVWFRYVFASEEYPESVCQFNDVFGFFISGPGISGPYAGNAVNIALLPGTTTPVSINNVNNGKFNQPDFPGCPAQNPQYYVENGVGDTPGINADIQYDGYTVELIAKASVVPCETYHIKLAVADAVDTYSNSGVFLEAGSFTSGTIITVDHFGQGAQNNMLYEGCENYFVFTRGDTTDVSADLHFNLTFSGTAQNGVDYTGFPGAWFIPAGQISDTVFYSGVLDEADEGTETLIYTFETLGNCPCSSNPVTFTDTIYIYDNLTLEGGLSYSDSTVCYPDSTTLVIWHNLQEEIVSYTWSSGETSQVISVSPESPQYWYLTVSDVCGQSLTDSVLVILNYPAAFSPLSDTSICTGQDISITVDTTGTPPIELQWCGPTGLIPDATDDTLNIPSTTEDNEGGYWCLASNVCDIVSSDTMLLGIVTDPAIVSQPASDTVCENDSAHFVLSVNETVSFQWFGPAGIITDTDDSLLVIFPATFSDTGVYYCVVTNACSSDVSDTARLTVASAPSVTLAVFDPVCLNDTAFLLTGGEPLNGTYFGSGTDTAGYFHPDIAGAGQHAVSYVYTDSIGCRDTAQQVLFVDALPVVTLGELSSMCMNAAPVTLTQGSPPGGYYTVNDTDTVSLFNPILTGAGMHTIAYIYTAPGGCTDTASDTITVFGLPVVSLDSIPDVCITLTPFHLTYSPADSGIFSGQGTDSTGMFNPENAGLGIHTIIYSYTDTNLCSNSDTQTVSVLTGPNVIPEVTDLLCTNSENGSVSLTISGGLEPYSFIWAHSSDTNRNLTNLAAGIYTVTVTDSSGCSTVGNISVGIVNDLTAFAGADVISCPGDTIQLSDSAYIADSVIYTWYPVTGLSDPDILTPLATPEVTTSYILSVEDTMCSVTDTVTITVVQPPVIEAGDDLILFPGTELILQFTVTDSIVSCIWSPADRLSNEYARNPVVSTAFQTEDETILFHVTGTSLDGCISKDSVCVRIVGFYIPKGFTPNGDGVNDLWVTDFLDRYPGAVIEVFNRWGEKLFEGGPGEDYWDGTRNGKPVPSGTYYYIVTVPEEVTAIFRRSGSVTILR